MKDSIFVDLKYLSMKVNWEKLIFHWEKRNFEPTGNSVHTTEIVALAKALLARLLYLKVKVYTTLLSVHNLLCL